jgi:hypothetical protein
LYKTIKNRLFLLTVKITNNSYTKGKS